MTDTVPTMAADTVDTVPTMAAGTADTATRIVDWTCTAVAWAAADQAGIAYTERT